MTRQIVWLLMTGMLTLIVPLTASASDPPSPITLVQFRTEGIPIASPFEVSQVLAQFPPGACTPLHTHSGQVVITVLTGAQVRTGTGPESGTYTAGQSWVETPGPTHQACNTGTVESTSMATYFLPKGDPLSHPLPGQQPSSPGPVTLAQSRADGLPITGPFDVVQVKQEFPPGACNPVHTHAGQVIITVLDGVQVRAGQGMGSGTYTAGHDWVETPGPKHQSCNPASVKATTMAVFLLPRGAPLSTPVMLLSMSSTPSSSFFIRRLGDG